MSWFSRCFGETGGRLSHPPIPGSGVPGRLGNVSVRPQRRVHRVVHHLKWRLRGGRGRCARCQSQHNPSSCVMNLRQQIRFVQVSVAKTVMLHTHVYIGYSCCCSVGKKNEKVRCCGCLSETLSRGRCLLMTPRHYRPPYILAKYRLI